MNWTHLENDKIIYHNKRVGFDYHMDDIHVAGVVLTKKDIMTVRSHAGFNLDGCMVRVEHREVWIHPTVGTEPRRIKLLLSRREITSLERAIQEGYRILPDLAFIDPRGWLKIRLVTAKPKKKYDKREALKEKDRRKHGE